jgi:hypothetical protein
MLKIGMWLTAALQKSSVQIQEIYQPIGRGDCTLLSKRVLLIQKLLVLSGQEL